MMHFILATAGHVDHGKSSLVKALTGTDPDRLPEEKARGITIDLGFAFLELTSALSGNPISIGIVDVPGHEDFVKNMVAGVASVDLALFVVAADDGWMPQTEEHLQILSYLGVERAVVALTKRDLVENLDSVSAEIRSRLQKSPFAQAEIIPVSSISGAGIPEIREAIVRALDVAPPPRDVGKPRLPIDRLFILRGVGTVVTGTLFGGGLARGQSVVIEPGNSPARIRSLQSHGRENGAVGPGTRTALNLPDLEVDSDRTSVRRGNVVTLPGLGKSSPTINIAVEISARSSLPGSKKAESRLKDGARVRLHHGSDNFPGRILLFGTKTLAPGERTVAQMRLEKPLYCYFGDRFIIRDWSEQNTLAGGIVLDPLAERRHYRLPAEKGLLEKMAATVDLDQLVWLQIERSRFISPGELFLQSNFAQDDIGRSIEKMLKTGRAFSHGDFVYAESLWTQGRTGILAAIDAAHRAQPDLAGVPINPLRSEVKELARVPGLLDAILGRLCETGECERTGATIKRRGYQAALPAALQSAGGRLRKFLSEKGLEPPSRKELAPDAASQQALRFLLQNGEAIDLGGEVVLAREQYLRAVQMVKDFLQKNRSGTVSELRQTLGSSRRIVVPLLEKFDREGITRRDGDKRVLKTM